MSLPAHQTITAVLVCSVFIAIHDAHPCLTLSRVAISAYDSSVRNAIKRTVETIGGRVSMECMSARDTHLIVPVARGEKYTHAARLNVTPVTADWLVDSVALGKLQPEHNYRPRPPPGKPPPQGEEGNGTANPSVVQNTQLPSAPGTKPSLQMLSAHVTSGRVAPGAQNAAQAKLRQGAAAGAAKGGGAKGNKLTLKERMEQLKGGGAAAGASRPPMASGGGIGPTSFDFDAMFGAAPSAPAAKRPEDANAAALAVASIIGGPQTEIRPAEIAENCAGNKQSKQDGPRPDGGSEEDGDLAAALNRVSSLLDRHKGGHDAMVHSQQDMPPPPPRGGQLDDQSQLRGGPASNGRSKLKRSWALAESEGAGAYSLRRSGRKAVASSSEWDGFELSQQVGYESIPAPVVASPGGGNPLAAQHAKERLQRAVAVTRQQKRGLKAGVDG